jgi:hypothetical protein
MPSRVRAQRITEEKSPPRMVKDLRVAGLTSDRVASSLEVSCSWLAVDGRTDLKDVTDMRPHIVLVEVADPREMDEPLIARLVAQTRQAGSLACLWLTDIANAGLCPHPIRDLFDAVFCTDPGFHGGLVPRAGSASIGLPHAAAHAALTAEESIPGSSGVGLVVEPGAPWDFQFSAELEPLLSAATAQSLSILAMEPRAPDIPSELASMVALGRSEEDRLAFLRKCGVILAASPAQASPRYVPAVVFDAVAMGVPVVVAPPLTDGVIMPRVVGFASTASPDELIEKALADREFGNGRRELGRKVVRHEHTYAHRLATAASVFGIAVMPFSP